MARNYEKNFGQLNRWWLRYVRKDVGKKERRPRLEHLKTAADIRKWLPFIKEEMEFCLMQSQVPCYTDGKVDEYRRKVMHLEVEYKNFVRKLRRLDATATVSQPCVQPYERKRLREVPLSMHPAMDVDSLPEKYEPIRLPVLDLEGNQPILEHHTDAVSSESKDLNPQHQDEPLTFKCSTFNDWSKQNPLCIDYSSSGEED